MNSTPTPTRRPFLKDLTKAAGLAVIAIIIGAIVLAASAGAADAKPYKRHRHAHAQHHRAVEVAAPTFGSGWPFSAGSSLVSAARSEIGNGAIYGRASLWCARFVNVMLARTGHSGTRSDAAASFAKYGQRVQGPQVGAIAVMSRGRRGGHVGVVSGVDARGNPIVISGNHNRRVAESVYPKSRVYAYVMPN